LISTDPQAVQGGAVETPDGQNQSASGSGGNNTGGNSGLILNNRAIAKTAGTTLPEKNTEIKVLGSTYYPDGSLLRGPDKKIYLIEGKAKKHILNLAELQKYRRKTIFNVTDEELFVYQERAHLNGELIREKGTVKVYAIAQSRRRHILNLEELRQYYFGREIFNIIREEMAKYK
ncbi:MAG: hypothetical protein MUC28_04370, partial [Planctomycetes bacterium]|nr:hypothetical protein [Planctomycetota bacterium]